LRAPGTLLRADDIRRPFASGCPPILHPFDIAVWEFATASDALDAVKNREPEVIFLNVSLERSEAIDVIRGLAELQFKGVVQLVSGRTNSILENIKAIGERYGLRMRAPLTKPFSMSAIRAIVLEQGLSVPILSTKPISLAEALDKIGWSFGISPRWISVRICLLEWRDSSAPDIPFTVSLHQARFSELPARQISPR